MGSINSPRTARGNSLSLEEVSAERERGWMRERATEQTTTHRIEVHEESALVRERRQSGELYGADCMEVRRAKACGKRKARE